MNLKHLAGACALGLASFALSAPAASAFCGFYVAKADTDLFNDASKVVLVRDDERTVITMASDYRGEASEFAMVVPVVAGSAALVGAIVQFGGGLKGMNDMSNKADGTGQKKPATT